jgi:hypothetical protein
MRATGGGGVTYGVVRVHTPREVKGRAGHAIALFTSASTEVRAVAAVVPSTDPAQGKNWLDAPLIDAANRLPASRETP